MSNPNPDDAPRPFSDVPDWLRDLFTPRAKCELHQEPQPCAICAITPKVPYQTPKESSVKIGVPDDGDDQGDQRGVE